MNHEYDPLKWPPDMALAELHLKCVRPGIDNSEGSMCPCCNRLQKLKNSKWPSRDIIKDFKNYGGGVPAYFELVIYFGICFAILTAVIVIYHIYILEIACPILENGLLAFRCQKMFGMLKFCDSELLYTTLLGNGNNTLAEIFSYLQLLAYLLLAMATIGIKIWLQHVNHHRISQEEKVLSRFALILKNVPRSYQIEDLRKSITDLDKSLQICEVFYVYRTAEYEHLYREYLDLFFQIRYIEQQLKENPDQKQQKQLKQKYDRYLTITKLIDQKKGYLNNSSKRAIVVFNTIEQKQLAHSVLRINEVTKFFYYTFKMVGINMKPLDYFSQKIAEPQEVHWKYIGESSTYKTKVRFETTFIGFGFMLISFGLFYFPMIKIDQEKGNAAKLGTILGLIISISLIVLAIVYRIIIASLMPKRRPSSRLAESYFIVLTTVVFHYFFYLITPATYYVFVDAVHQNIKLKQLFLAVVTFIAMTVLVACIDMKYVFYNRKKKRLLFQHAHSSQYCQQRLHEELNPPSFPIEFKLMVILNIWTFNAFYIFEIPYLLFLFLIVLLILYWVDKRHLYKHYKMQSFLSIELQLKIQKTYIILFLICVSVGYWIASTHSWQKYVIIGIFILALIINFTLNYSYKKMKVENEHIRKSSTLRNVLKETNKDLLQSFHHNLLENELKSSFLVIPEFSSASLASEDFTYGYQQIYHRYLNQFKNKDVNDMLSNKVKDIERINSNQQKQADLNCTQKKRKESELVSISLENQLKTGLVQHLLGQREEEEELGQKSEEKLDQNNLKEKIEVSPSVEPVEIQNKESPIQAIRKPSNDESKKSDH